MQSIPVDVNGRICYLAKGSYSNDRTAIVLLCSDESLYATVTVNLSDVPLAANELFIKTYSENTELAKCVLDSGIFEDTFKRVQTGFVEIEVWRIKDKGRFDSIPAYR